MPAKLKNYDWEKDLKFFLDKGMSLHKACKHANVSPHTAYANGYRSTRKFIYQFHSELIEMLEEKMSYKQIAYELGFSQGAIATYCRIQCGISKRAHIYRHHAKIVDMREAGVSYQEIARELKTSTQTVGNYCRLKGIKKG